MNKKERVMCALKGGETDRPPFSFWYHFGLQHMPGRKHAEAQVDFFKAYDLDFLKVMNEYPYPLPEGLEAVVTEDDWKRVEPVGHSHGCWAEQLDALSVINDAIGQEALFIDTIFSPWTTARRMTRNGTLAETKERHPEALLSAMDAIATTLAVYAKEAVARGAAGIFLSVGAASDEVMTEDEYMTWGRPFDLKVLDAVKDAPFNVLHIHGKRIHFEGLLDYPASAINWSHFATQPSLKDGKAQARKTVMGGIDEAAASHISPPAMREQVLASLREVGTTGVIVTPGCSVSTDTPERTLRAIKEAVTRAASAQG